MKNLNNPCSVTFPLRTYGSVTSGSFPSFASSLAELFQRTPSTRDYHADYPATMTSEPADLTASANFELTGPSGM